jgi:hypothetical protein
MTSWPQCVQLMVDALYRPSSQDEKNGIKIVALGFGSLYIAFPPTHDVQFQESWMMRQTNNQPTCVISSFKLHPLAFLLGSAKELYENGLFLVGDSGIVSKTTF